jgi:hypothetical protein
MLRSPFSGHRRYSITHRAVQRLRELVPGVADEDDENLRDRLDAAIVSSEDNKKAVKTLDVMLSEPQVLVPLESFGETLYAIIKEDTVVTVLPRGHGEEILQRGRALEQRVAAGEVSVPQQDREEDRWEFSRRRWRRDAPVPVIERVIRGGSANNGLSTVSSDDLPDHVQNEVSGPVREEIMTPQRPASRPLSREAFRPSLQQPARPKRKHAEQIRRAVTPYDQASDAASDAPNSSESSSPAPKRVVVNIPERIAEEQPRSEVEEILAASLERGRRRAAIAALSELLKTRERDTEVLPLWNDLLDDGLPATLTIGDLLDAVQRVNA